MSATLSSWCKGVFGALLLLCRLGVQSAEKLARAPGQSHLPNRWRTVGHLLIAMPAAPFVLMTKNWCKHSRDFPCEGLAAIA